jgi:hypothetical protein
MSAMAATFRKRSIYMILWHNITIFSLVLGSCSGMQLSAKLMGTKMVKRIRSPSKQLESSQPLSPQCHAPECRSCRIHARHICGQLSLLLISRLCRSFPPTFLCWPGSPNGAAAGHFRTLGRTISNERAYPPRSLQPIY